MLVDSLIVERIPSFVVSIVIYLPNKLVAESRTFDLKFSDFSTYDYLSDDPFNGVFTSRIQLVFVYTR